MQTLIGLTPDRDGVWVYNGLGMSSWIQVGGPASEIVARTNVINIQ